MTAALEATGVGKRYGRRWALRDCCLRLPGARVVALVGANGAGKTTLLHLAVGLVRPTTGDVRVLGQSVSERRSQFDQVGFVAQDAPLYRGFTIDDMLCLGARLNPRFDLSLARRRLERFQVRPDRRVGELSGGQRAQVALALALAKRPALLMLDEPVASLDPLARHEFLGALMEGAVEDGMTVVLSSHLLADLERVCDYLVVITSARVRVAGTIEELLDSHRVFIGPRSDIAPAGVHAVITARHAARQTTLVARLKHPVLDPRWDERPVSLEELVLAYMGNADASALPPPTLASEQVDAT